MFYFKPSSLYASKHGTEKLAEQKAVCLTQGAGANTFKLISSSFTHSLSLKIRINWVVIYKEKRFIRLGLGRIYHEKSQYKFILLYQIN